MKLAIVRMKDNKELVGIFAYNKNDDLFWYVDECIDPCVCEYINIENGGGIYWPNSSAPKVNSNFCNENDSFDGAQISSLLQQNYDDEKWDDVLLDSYREIRNKLVKITGMKPN